MFLFIIFPFLALILLPAILHKIYVKKHEKHLKNVPGPKPNPFLGNALDFAVPTHEFLNVLSKYFDKYGPIVKVYDGPQSTFLLIAEEKLIEHILRSTQILDKSTQYVGLANWLGNGLLTSTGAKWKSRRRMITPAFHFSILENFVEIFENVGEILIKKLESQVGNENLDVYPLVTLCALDVICEAAMGISVNAQVDNDSKYIQAVKTMNKIVTDRNMSPLDHRLYPFTVNYYKEKSVLKIIHSKTDSVIKQRIKELENVKEDVTKDEFGMKRKLAFLDLLLKSTIDGNPLSKADIRAEVDTFMFEGHDTSSSAISFALYCLANHPVVQEKALQEQREIFGDLKSPKVTLNELQKMNYLDLVIKETLRLYPSVPFFGRNVSEDFEFGDMTIPKGQQLLIVPFLCHRNPKYYPNPTKFIPERFLEIDGSNPYRYIAFSAGPRNCIGQKFAMFEMKSTISMVLRNFKLLPAKPELQLQLAPEVILISKSGIRLSLKKRE